MFLRQRETGMVLEQAKTERRGNGRQRGVVWWSAVTGIVRDSGKTTFAKGTRIAWPYNAEDWEVVSE